jgi:hypothetical protein
VIIDDGYIIRTGIGPSKAHPVLVIDPNAVLSFAVAS